MRNKMLIIIGVVVVLLIALYFVDDLKNDTDEADKESSGEENDEDLYDNQTNPDDLREKIDEGDPVTVYFYSPECTHCQRTTPVLVPLTEEKDIDMKKLNIQKYEEQWDEYDIEGTPTVAHFDDGKEVARITGEQSEEDFSVFFDEYVLDNE